MISSALRSSKKWFHAEARRRDSPQAQRLSRTKAAAARIGRHFLMFLARPGRADSASCFFVIFVVKTLFSPRLRVNNSGICCIGDGDD